MLATIVSSDLAPAEAVHYCFANVEFDVDPKKGYGTDDMAVITNAAEHPWLTVKFDATENGEGVFHDQIAPADDAMSFIGGIGASDPDAAAQAEAAKEAAVAMPVAIEAGKDQSTEVVTADVVETLAAVPAPPKTSKTKDVN